MVKTAQRMALIQGTRLGRYEIRSHIGAGGMGEVYLAQDTELGRVVAVKVLPEKAAANPKQMRRFVQEAKKVSALNHPNIITIHEIGQEGPVQFMTTEFINGVTLLDHIKNTRMRVGEVLDVAMQIASALDSAHEAGIVHRDIKPANIMLRKDGYVKVLDFGLAKLLQPPVIDQEARTQELIKTDSGMVMGTCHYMSPEQARGQEVDHQTDIWSLGVVMYQMLTGSCPFAGPTATDVLASIIMAEPAPLIDSWPEIPEQLDHIVSKALSKETRLRYQSAKDLLIDLRLLKQRLDVESEMQRITRPFHLTSTGTATAAQKSKITGKHQGRTKTLAKSTLRRRQSSSEIDSLAVLPLINSSDDPNREYLSDGITESIINTLSQIPDVKVMARSTVFRYKGREVDPQEVGRALNVRAVLTGKLLQLGQNLIIKAELVDVLDGSQLWGGQYNRKPADVLAIQEEISYEITEKLRLKLSSDQKQRLKKRHTENTRAYQLYLKGRYFWNKRTEEGLKKGIEFFNLAIEEDPVYALAYVGLADSYIMLATYDLSPPNAVLSSAKGAAKRALEIDDQLAEAHTSLAKVRADFDWNWSAAENEFKRALELNSNYATAHHWYSLHLMAMGQFDKAAAQIKRAQQLDPLSLSISASMGLPFYWQRHYNEAIQHFRRTLELDLNFAVAHVLLGQAYAQKGMFEDAIAELRRARRLDGTARVRAILGYIFAAAGRRSEAEKILSDLQELSERKYVSPYFRALLYASLGNGNRAFDWLEKAFEERSGWLIWLRVDPNLDSLSSESRFQELVMRIGLPEALARPSRSSAARTPR